MVLAQNPTLSKAADNTRLGKVTDTLNYFSAIHDHFKSQKKWMKEASQSLIEGNANFCTQGEID